MLNSKIIPLFISIWVMPNLVIAQDAWSKTLNTQIDEKDVRIETSIKIDTAKQSFDIRTKFFFAVKSRPLIKKLDNLTVGNLSLAGEAATVNLTELFEDTVALKGIHLAGVFKKVTPGTKLLPCSLVLSFGKKGKPIDLNYKIEIEDKEKERENAKKELEEKTKADSIAKDIIIIAEAKLAKVKRLEKEKKDNEVKAWRALKDQLINTDSIKKVIVPIQLAYNSFQQAAAASTPDRPGDVLSLKRKIVLQALELPRLFSQLQKKKTQAAALDAAISAANHQGYHNKEQFASLQQNNSSVQKNIGAFETLIHQLQLKFGELLGKQIFDRKYLDITAEGKIYNTVLPAMDSSNSGFSRLDDNLTASMKYVSAIAAKEKKGTHNCDSLWKLYDMFLGQRENINKEVEYSRTLYQKKIIEFKAVLKTGKVDAVEQQLADLDKYNNSIEKKNKELGAHLTGIDCKPVIKTRLPLFILCGVLVLALFIFFFTRYRKKRVESQIKFLN